MGRTIQLWHQRSQTVTTPLCSPVFDAADVRDGTVFLRVLALTGGGTALISAEHSLDPNDPNSWSVLVGVLGSAVGNFTDVLGGYIAGSTVPVGPFVRFRADIVLGLGDRIVWSASVTLRSD